MRSKPRRVNKEPREEPVPAQVDSPPVETKKPSLLSREDWGTALILATLFCILSFIAGYLGALLGGAW